MKKQLMVFLLLLLGVAGTSLAQTGLDQSFGQGGINKAWGNVDDVTLIKSKAYFLGGYAEELPKKILAFVLLNSGKFDSSFGGKGYVYGDSIVLLQGFSPNYIAGLQNNGILLLDKISDRTGQVVHFDSVGKLDYSYGQNGKAYLPALEFPVMSTDAQDRLLYAGKCYGCWGDTMSILRYKANGTPDSSFGINGRVNTYPTGQYGINVYSVETATDGKVVVGEEDWNSLWAAYRYHPDGRVDSSFGGDGHTAIHWSGRGLTKALPQPDGKVLLCGYGDSVTVVRLNADGTMDNSYGKSGIARATPGLVQQAALKPDGSLVLGGFIDSSFALWQLTSAGKPDTAFGQHGVLTLKVTGGEHRMNGLAIQQDGKIIIGGNAKRLAPYPYDTTYAVVARFEKNGRLDVTNPQLPVGKSPLLDLFPNPAGDKLNVLYSILAGKSATVIIYDVVGRVMQQVAVNTTLNRSEVDVQFLAPGLYILELRGEDGSSARKQFLKK